MHLRSEASQRNHRWSPMFLVFMATVVVMVAGCNKPRSYLEPWGQAVAEPTPVVPERIPYSLTPGDEINVRLIGADEELRDLSFRINADGQFQYPYVGPVRAEGLTTNDLRKKLGQQLSPYFVDPNVIVNLTTEEQLFVNVLGEVRDPGAVRVQPGMRITDAIARAGDLTFNAARKRVILIRRTSEDEIRAGYFNYYDAMFDPLSGAYASNVPVARGDIIFVPRNGRAQWESAFQFISAMFNPVVDIERSIVLYPDVRDIINDGEATGRNTIVVR